MKKFILLVITIFLSLSFIVVEVITNNESNGIIICIDPGHGGSDGGAIGKDDTYEKDIVLSISLKLKEVFEKNKFTVIMTRSSDVDLASSNSKNRKRDDIHQRVEIINSSNCALFLSIHANSFGSGKSYGAQVFYNHSDENNYLLAKLIQDAIMLTLANTYRLCKIIDDVYLLNNAIPTGCLVEVGFMSNPSELKLLKDEQYQQKLAGAIYLGACEYLLALNKKF